MRMAVMIALVALAAAAFAAAPPLPFIDLTSVLRFVAPTAFETRSIEEILEGGRP